ncbi:hypothetical protein NFC81_15515 [Salinispirillum sp. LH 10-3-1]|uniref:Outer membrane protein beta-barrel domain-containing protein n=1 Tax=Salinispirillum sp. LH 10-3-1 TaxID=2952525 RepID=A0AB38YFF5_9GAMM
MNAKCKLLTPLVLLLTTAHASAAEINIYPASFFWGYGGNAMMPITPHWQLGARLTQHHFDHGPPFTSYLGNWTVDTFGARVEYQWEGSRESSPYGTMEAYRVQERLSRTNVGEVCLGYVERWGLALKGGYALYFDRLVMRAGWGYRYLTEGERSDNQCTALHTSDSHGLVLEWMVGVHL